MAERNDPDGIRLPIKLDSTGNGESRSVRPKTRRAYLELKPRGG